MRIKKIVTVSIKATTDDYKVLEKALDLLKEMDVDLNGDETLSEDVINLLSDVSNASYLLDNIISNLKKIGE